MLKCTVQKHKIQLMYLATSLTQILSTGSKWVLMDDRVNCSTKRTGYGVSKTSSNIKTGLVGRPINTDPRVPWSGLVKRKRV